MSANHNLSAEEIDRLKYPIGKIHWEKEYTMPVIQSLTEKIETQAGALREVASKLKPEDLKCSYRPGGWNIRQIIHHVPDSSLNAYIRTKLALTEELPTVKPYDENKWAELADNLTDINVSVNLVEAVHLRWTYLLRSMKHEDFLREFYHPEMKRNVPLTNMLSIYAWHGHHHIAQIKSALEKRF